MADKDKINMRYNPLAEDECVCGPFGQEEETVESLSRDYRKYPNYEPPIRWWQFWRYHKYFTLDYQESRWADKFLSQRIEEVYDQGSEGK